MDRDSFLDLGQNLSFFLGQSPKFALLLDEVLLYHLRRSNDLLAVGRVQSLRVELPVVLSNVEDQFLDLANVLRLVCKLV